MEDNLAYCANCYTSINMDEFLLVYLAKADGAK
jgi:hypothetical protein